MVARWFAHNLEIFKITTLNSIGLRFSTSKLQNCRFDIQITHKVSQHREIRDGDTLCQKVFTLRERVQALTVQQPEVPSLWAQALFWALHSSHLRTLQLARMVFDCFSQIVSTRIGLPHLYLSCHSGLFEPNYLITHAFVPNYYFRRFGRVP